MTLKKYVSKYVRRDGKKLKFLKLECKGQLIVQLIESLQYL